MCTNTHTHMLYAIQEIFFSMYDNDRLSKEDKFAPQGHFRWSFFLKQKRGDNIVFSPLRYKIK